MSYIGKQVSSVTTRPPQNRLLSSLKKVHTCTARGACMYFFGYKSVLLFIIMYAISTKRRGQAGKKCQKIRRFSSGKAFCPIFLVMRLGGYSNFVCVKRTKQTQWLIISRKILSHADLANLAEAHLLSLVLTSGMHTLGSMPTAAPTRYESVGCDERNFSSSEERASAPLL